MTQKEQIIFQLNKWIGNQIDDIMTGNRFFAPFIKKYVSNYVEKLTPMLDGLFKADGTLDNELFDYLITPFKDHTYNEKFNVLGNEVEFKDGMAVTKILGKTIAIDKNDVEQLIKAIRENVVA